MLVCKALAGLLLYPDEALIEALPEIRALVKASDLAEREEQAVLALCDRLASVELFDAQSDYVALFDRMPSLSLYLFEHVHGDSRERGQAMADLIEDYRRKGLELTSDELPDFLPVFLEFASLHEPAEARLLLSEIADVVGLLAARLEARDSRYAAALRAIETLGGRKADPEILEARLADEEPTDSPEALDARYEEAPVDFMQPVAADAACSRADSMVAQFSPGLPAQSGRQGGGE